MTADPALHGGHSNSVDATASPWRILVVDDDGDVHAVTTLALKHRRWQRRKFELVSALSAAEAKELVTREGAPKFDVALVDVVMETATAGLELCEFLRNTFPPSLRIVLRTGQPGVAPEEQILTRLDVDYYLAKSDVTADRLYAVLRACIRSSQDISTLLAHSSLTKEMASRQINEFSRSIHKVTSTQDLLVFMNDGLKFLELKHDVRTVFIHSVDEAPGEDAWRNVKASAESVMAALVRLHGQSEPAALPDVWTGEAAGLSNDAFAMPFALRLEGSGEMMRGGLYCEVLDTSAVSQIARRISADATLFTHNWKIAINTLKLQERIARERTLRDLMYQERLEGIANMVAGVAHEINTPLGVANTAISMLGTLMSRVKTTQPGPLLDKTYANIEEAGALISRNIIRAHRLVESFKKLSTGQLADRRSKVDLNALVADCIDSMRPVTGKKSIEIVVHAPSDPLIWEGFAGHLSQVIINFIQNTVRYAYPDVVGGKVDVRLSADVVGDREVFRIEFEDYGKGIAPEVYPRLFEPFVTTGREQGGTGLGLAISHNIVANLLKGRVHCESEYGKGSRFVVEIPRVVPTEDAANPAGHSGKPLGAILLDQGVITQGQLDRALQIQRSEGGRLGEILVRNQNINEEQLRVALALQRQR